MGLFADLGKTTSPSAGAPAGEGLKPNSFALQMFGQPQRPSIGFGPGSEKFVNQIPGGMQTVTPGAPTGAPAAAPADPWGNMGVLGSILKMIDGMRTKNGMPSITDNPEMMKMFQAAGSRLPPAGTFINDGMSGGN